MRKNLGLITTILFISVFLQTSFADKFQVRYHEVMGDRQGDCPGDVALLAKNGSLAFVFASQDYQSVHLLGSLTPRVSVTDKILLANEGINGEYAFMSTEETYVNVSNNRYLLQQLWLEGDTKRGPWQSAFYLGEDRECLVSTSAEARENYLKNEQIIKIIKH